MREKRSLCVEAGLEKVAPFSELPGENSNVPPYKGMGVGGSAQKAPISVISETQEWQSTAADDLPVGPKGDDTLSSDFSAPRAVGKDEGRTESTWLLLAALLPGAVGEGAAGLSGRWTLWVEVAPRLGNRFLRAGRMVPATLCTGVDRRAEMG